MRKILKIIFILLGILLLIGAGWHYLGRSQLSKLEGIIPSEELSKIQSISPEEILKPTEEEKEREYKEFVSPDGKLKMSYSSDWIEIKEEEILEKISPKEWVERYNLKHLFLAQRFTAEGRFAQLVIDEGVFAAEKLPKEIIEEMKESNREQGWDMEIIKLELKEDVAIFEARYQKPDRYDVHSKEKILLAKAEKEKKKVYLIAFITFDKDWLEFVNEAELIINSVQLVP